MESPIDRIKKKLRKYTDVGFAETDRSICVHPVEADGFPVSFHDEGTEFIVSFAGWHEHFDEVDAALNCFAMGLTDAVRLKVFSRGDFEYRWVLECRRGNAWIAESETGLFFVPFWRKKSVKYFQNRIILTQEDPAN